MKKSLVFLAAVAGIAFLCMDNSIKAIGENSNFNSTSYGKLNLKETTEDRLSSDSPFKYLGYGRNVTINRKIYDGAPVNQSYGPILDRQKLLDVNNQELKERVKAVDGTKGEVLSKSGESVSEISKNFGFVAAGGIKGKIAMVSADLNATFDRGSSSRDRQSEHYEICYNQNIVKHVYSGLDAIGMQKYLDPQYKELLYNVDTEEDAYTLLTRYGTHIPNAYDLGGVLEMTNYFAAFDSEYQRQESSSLQAQIEIAIAANKGNADFSISNNHGVHEDSQRSMNTYKCVTYGGWSISAFTIDQLFARVVDFHKYSGFLYNIWQNTVAEGRGLVMTGIPFDAEMIPVWNLLPSTTKYQNARTLLINKYAEMAQASYREYLKQNKNVVTHGQQNIFGDNTAYDIEVQGYEYAIKDDSTTNEVVQYKELDPNQTSVPEPIVPGSRVALKLSDDTFIDGKTLDFFVDSSAQKDYVNWLDRRNGIFEINAKTESLGDDFWISAIVNGNQNNVKKIQKFKVSGSPYFGGDGTTDDPYLIGNYSQLKQFFDSGVPSGDSPYSVCATLINDIRVSNSDTGMEADLIKSINNFGGTFDGNYHTIYGLQFSPKHENPEDYKGDYSMGLFKTNTGTIKNLTLNYEDVDNNGITNVKALDGGKLTQYSFNSFGLLSGTNKGNIINCHVNNADITLRIDSDIQPSSNNGCVNAGILVGKNEKLIEDCDVTNSKIDVVKGHCAFLNVGGLVGLAQSEGGALNSKINRCYTKRNIIKSSNGTYEHDNYEQYNDVGGFVGRVGGFSKNSGALLTDCSSISNSIEAISLTKKPQNNSACKMHNEVGGFAGLLWKYGTKLEYCISYISKENLRSFIYVSNQPGIPVLATDRFLLNSGTFAGFAHNENRNASNIFAEDLEQLSLPTVGYGADFKGKVTANIDCKYINLSANLNGRRRPNSEKDYWVADSLGYPIISKVGLVEDDILKGIDTRYAKKTFFVDDAFSVGQINIELASIEGPAIKFNQYLVDDREFDSSIAKTNIPIYVTAFGVTKVYEVNVIDPSPKKIYVHDEPTKNQYFVGEEFDPSGMTIKVNLNNGNTEVVPSSEITYECPTIVEGQNKVKIFYKGVKTEYYVDGIVREIDRLEVTKGPNKTVFKVGTESVPFEGVEANVIYKDGTIKAVNHNDLEFTLSRVVNGKNLIIASYDAYYNDFFYVDGKYDEALLPKVEEFVKTVQLIRLTQVLDVKYGYIISAIKLKKEIGEYSSDSYDAAVIQLDLEIDNYNKLINGINKDFMEAVEIGQTFTYSLAVAGGSTILAIIILLIKNKFGF